MTRFFVVLTLIVAMLPEVGFAGRGGAQAVLFSRWNASSVANICGAVNDAAPPEFELAQAPFFDGDGRWQNTVTFLQNVSPATRVTGTFFLSFHTDQPGYDLGRRAANLNAFLIKAQPALGGRTAVEQLDNLVLSPQLEDEFDDNVWISKMRLILDKLDEAKILRSGKLRLRRSISKYNSSLSRLEYQRGANSYAFAVRVERHGLASVPSSGIWSNDGDFVYKELTLGGVREDRSSMVDSINGTFRATSLADFATNAKGRSEPTLLWRPAYNLFRREISGGKVSWIRDANLPMPWDRVDSGTAFDLREKRVLTEFLNGIR